MSRDGKLKMHSALFIGKNFLSRTTLRILLLQEKVERGMAGQKLIPQFRLNVRDVSLPHHDLTIPFVERHKSHLSIDRTGHINTSLIAVQKPLPRRRRSFRKMIACSPFPQTRRVTREGKTALTKQTDSIRSAQIAGGGRNAEQKSDQNGGRPDYSAKS